MVLKKKVKASSIAEIVVALAVISICFGISSLIFIRTTGSSKRLIDLEKQTAIQSQIFEKLLTGDLHLEDIVQEDVDVINSDDPNHDSLDVITFVSNDNKVLWTISDVKNELIKNRND